MLKPKEDSETKLIEWLKTLFEKKNHKHIVYTHNAANFDWVLIIAALLKFAGNRNIKLRTNELKLITMSVKFNGVTIKFFDSFQLLPHSLDKLARWLGTKLRKLCFPHDSIENLPLDYIGTNPLDSNDTKWNLEEKLEKYMRNDVELLEEIITIFKKNCMEEYNVDITKAPTISSLALRIFRINFYKQPFGREEEKRMKGETKKELETKEEAGRIGITELFKPKRTNKKAFKRQYNKGLCEIKGKLYKIFKKALYGGRTEVFETHIRNGWEYDINSMYPSIMLKKMPIGTPHFFKGEFDWQAEERFSICFAKVRSPKNCKQGALPLRYRGRIIYPIGQWKGWYASDELKNAKEEKWKV